MLRIRALGAVLVVVGLAHVLAPERMLALGELPYDHLFAVNFDPRDDASLRTRAFGVALAATGAHLAYHGGVLPSRP